MAGIQGPSQAKQSPGSQGRGVARRRGWDSCQGPKDPTKAESVPCNTLHHCTAGPQGQGLVGWQGCLAVDPRYLQEPHRQGGDHMKTDPSRRHRGRMGRPSCRHGDKRHPRQEGPATSQVAAGGRNVSPPGVCLSCCFRSELGGRQEPGLGSGS